MAHIQLGEFTSYKKNKTFWQEYNRLSLVFANCLHSADSDFSGSMRLALDTYRQARSKLYGINQKFKDGTLSNEEQMLGIKQMREQYIDGMTEGDITAHFRQLYIDKIEAQRNTATQIADQFLHAGHVRLYDGGENGKELRGAIEKGNTMCEDFNRIFSHEKLTHAEMGVLRIAQNTSGTNFYRGFEDIANTSGRTRGRQDITPPNSAASPEHKRQIVSPSQASVDEILKSYVLDQPPPSYQPQPHIYDMGQILPGDTTNPESDCQSCSKKVGGGLFCQHCGGSQAAATQPPQAAQLTPDDQPTNLLRTPKPAKKHSIKRRLNVDTPTTDQWARAQFNAIIEDYKKNQNFNLLQRIDQQFPEHVCEPARQVARYFLATFQQQQPQAAATIPINTNNGYLHAPSKFDPYFEGLTTITNPYFIESAYDL